MNIQQPTLKSNIQVLVSRTCFGRGILCLSSRNRPPFTYRGRRFSFDPATDINLEGLDFDTIERYLELYDPRFVSFFSRTWRRP